MNNKQKQTKEKTLHKTCLQPPENLFVAFFFAELFAKAEAVLDLPHVLEGVSPV